MRKFLNKLDEYIIILGYDLNVIFCNKKILDKLNCEKEETHKISINISKEYKNKLKSCSLDNEINISLRIGINNRVIELENKAINVDFEGKNVILISSKEVKLINYKEAVKGKIIEENIEEEKENVQLAIKKLNYIIEKLEQTPSAKEMFEQIDIITDLEFITGEIHKVDLIKKDFEFLLSMSADLITILDMNGNLNTGSQAWKHSFGWSNKEILASNLLDLIHEDEKQILKNIIYSKDTNLNTIENRVMCKDKSFKWVRWNIRYVDKMKTFVLTGKDIHKEKCEEIKRKKLEDAIYLENIKNEFFANMSHEFKTPLNIILGTVQVVDKKIDYEPELQNNINLDIVKYTKLIKQNSYRLLKLINNLIDISKIENNYYELKLGNHNIINVVEDITLSVAQYIQGKGKSIIFDTDVEEYIIACDPEKIERILLNILSNSIKHTGEYGHIEVNINTNKENVVITINDNGEGISKEKLPIVFNRFVQDNSILTRSYEGSGIGLSLVKSLIDLHSGSVNIESEKGTGTKVEIILPNKMLIAEEKLKNKKITHENYKVEMCDIEFSDIYNL